MCASLLRVGVVGSVCCVFGVRGVSVLRVGLGLRCRRMVGACVVCLLCVRVRVSAWVFRETYVHEGTQVM